MEGQVAEEEKNRRSRVLIGMGKAHERNYMESFLGKEVEILFEETAEIQGETYWTGHTREYLKTAVKVSENLENRIMTATVTGFLQDGIFICRI